MYNAIGRKPRREAHDLKFLASNSPIVAALCEPTPLSHALTPLPYLQEISALIYDDMADKGKWFRPLNYPSIASLSAMLSERIRC
jgi:hypothetical protein